MHSCAFFPKGLGVRPPVTYFQPASRTPSHGSSPDHFTPRLTASQSRVRVAAGLPRTCWGEMARQPAGSETRVEAAATSPPLPPGCNQPPGPYLLPTRSLPRDAADAGNLIGSWGRALETRVERWSPLITPLRECTPSAFSRPWASSHTPIFPQVGFGRNNTRDYT